jgi:hypothetical protein
MKPKPIEETGVGSAIADPAKVPTLLEAKFRF